jgi:hypothetical protein
VAQSAEFILEPTHKQLLVLEPWGPSFESVLRGFSTHEGLQVVECSSITELISVARQISYCVVLAYCASSSESERYKDLLKALQGEILSKKIRVIIAIGESRDLKPVFLQAGASEVFQEPVGEKVLTSKIEYAISLLAARAPEGTKAPARKASSQFLWVSPLGLESDCWLAIKDDIKLVAGKWMIPMIGPSPKYGQWCAVQAEGSNDRWEWVPTQLMDDPFIREEGAWFFRGECPEFRGGTWVFHGSRPELSFIYKEESYGNRFSMDENTLVIAEDSARAKIVIEMVEKRESNQKKTPKMAQAFGTAQSEQAIVEVQKPFLLVAPLEIQSDCFAREERIPRFIDGSWVMRLSGPTPSHGTWRKARTGDGTSTGEQPLWQWETSSRDSFIVEKGEWIFQGAEPSYRDGLWTFSSRKPRFEFVSSLDPQKGRTLARKIAVDSREVFLLAEDSQTSLNALERLLSFRKRPPGYLKRAKYGTKLPQASKGLFSDAPIHPIAAAFFIAELSRQRDVGLESLLKRYCEMLSQACGGGTVAPWLWSGSTWKCLNHNDLMDLSVVQKIEASQPAVTEANSGLQIRVIENAGARIVVSSIGETKIGALLFSGEKCGVFKETELRAYARACAGVWLSCNDALSQSDKKAVA